MTIPAALGLLCAAAAISFLTVQTLKQRSTIENTGVLLTGGDLDLAPATFRRYGCAGCHTIPGVPGADGLVGPKLSGLSKQVFIAGVLPNNAENLQHWIIEPERYSPHTAMPASGVSPREAKDLAAYLYSN